MSDQSAPPIQVIRAPVQALWATIVAEALGHPRYTALTLGRYVTSSSARIKATAVTIEPILRSFRDALTELTARARPRGVVRLPCGRSPLFRRGLLRSCDTPRPPRRFGRCRAFQMHLDPDKTRDQIGKRGAGHRRGGGARSTPGLVDQMGSCGFDLKQAILNGPQPLIDRFQRIPQLSLKLEEILSLTGERPKPTYVR
jgi:hypothetical protein